MKSELSVRWLFFVNFCRYIGYFKKLTWFPSVTYLGLQTGKVWAKSIFRPWPRFLWFIVAITLNWIFKRSWKITKRIWIKSVKYEINLNLGTHLRWFITKFPEYLRPGDFLTLLAWSRRWLRMVLKDPNVNSGSSVWCRVSHISFKLLYAKTMLMTGVIHGLFLLDYMLRAG